MNIKMSPKELGRWISDLRKRKTLSQEVLAKSVNLSRPTLSQIELGNRDVHFREMEKLAKVLEVSLDDLFLCFDDGVKVVVVVVLDEVVEPLDHEERALVPILHLSKFKSVLLYLLEGCAGQPNVSETVLFTLLYFSDFTYYEVHEEHLQGLLTSKPLHALFLTN